MPYDSNGNHSLTAGYQGTTGQTILTSQHNPPLEDISASLSQVLLRSGVAPMAGPLDMNGFKATGLAPGTADTDAATVGQITAAASVEDTINAATEKTTLVDADRFPITDSAATFALKRITWANIKTALNATFLQIANIVTAAQFRNNTADKVLTTGPVWDSAAVVALTDAVTIAVDMATFFNASVTIAGNRTLGNPTNPKVGQSGVIRVTASGATRTIAKGSSWKSTTTFPVSITSGASAYLYYHVYSSTLIVVNVVNGPS